MKCAQVFSLTTLLVLCTFQWSSVVSKDVETEFGINMYKKISNKNPERNIFFSPSSISTVLGMLLLGAGGNTKTQIKAVLKLKSFPTDSEIFMEYKRILEILETKDRENIVHLANQLFLSNKFTFNPVFVKDLLKYFHATLKGLDFTKPEESRRQINEWVSTKTNKKIKDLLLEGSITPTTVLEIVAAMHVLAKWQYPFDVKNTKPGTFTTSKDEKISVDMMKLSPKLLNYVVSSELNCELVELPFVGDRLVMYILLPKEGKFGETQKSLTLTSLIKVRNSLKKRLVEVILPKFKTDQRIPLKNHLKSLGMTDLFDEKKSNLSGIITKGSRLLYSSEIAHKIVFNINEYGVLTDTAGSPGVKDSSSTGKPVTPLHVDRPFMYMLYDKKANVTLQCGHVLTKPTLDDVLE